MGKGVPDYVGYEVQVGGGVYFGDYEGVEVGSFELGCGVSRVHRRQSIRVRGQRATYNFSKVIKRQPTIHRIDPYGLLPYALYTRLFKQLPQVRPRFCLLARRYGVFKIVGHAVDVQAAGFVEHLLRGPGHYLALLLCCKAFSIY